MRNAKPRCPSSAPEPEQRTRVSAAPPACRQKNVRHRHITRITASLTTSTHHICIPASSDRNESGRMERNMELTMTRYAFMFPPAQGHLGRKRRLHDHADYAQTRKNHAVFGDHPQPQRWHIVGIDEQRQRNQQHQYERKLRYQKT